MAFVILGSRVSKISDPMSGFFLFRRSAVNPDVLRPLGFKILVEIAARHPRLRVAEVTYEFGTRQAGDSKASTSEGLRYLLLLARLKLQDRSDRELGHRAPLVGSQAQSMPGHCRLQKRM